MKKYAWLSIVVLFILFAFISGINIKGKIMDENGNPLVGASITIKGTKGGTSSDANGQFSITVPNEKAVLVVAYVGYVNKEIKVGSQSFLSIKMEAPKSDLQEVVVTTGLGVTRNYGGKAAGV